MGTTVPMMNHGPNHGHKVAIDLETIADRELLKILPPVEVKTGNIKDQEKIKAKQQEAEENRVANMGVNKYENMICVFSWCDGAGSGGLVLGEESAAGEKELLAGAWEIMSRYNHFITFNGNEFDIPILNLHSMFRGVRPAVNISTNKYRITNHTDLRSVFSGGDKFEPGNLDYYLRRCLNRSKPKDISGAMVQDWWDIGAKEEILAYGIGDAVDTFALYQYAREFFPGIDS